MLRGAVSHAVIVGVALVASACGEREPTGAAEPVALEPPPAVFDAGVADAAQAQAPIMIHDPSAGFHLDDELVEYRRPGRRPARAPERRRVELTLRSSPPGAMVAVDGVVVGRTPAYWEGEAGTPREFTFVLPGHGMARYRFVPVTSGVVHGRLTRLAKDVGDAGPPAL